MVIPSNGYFHNSFAGSDAARHNLYMQSNFIEPSAQQSTVDRQVLEALLQPSPYYYPSLPPTNPAPGPIKYRTRLIGPSPAHPYHQPKGPSSQHQRIRRRIPPPSNGAPILYHERPVEDRVIGTASGHVPSNETWAHLPPLPTPSTSIIMKPFSCLEIEWLSWLRMNRKLVRFGGRIVINGAANFDT